MKRIFPTSLFLLLICFIYSSATYGQVSTKEVVKVTSDITGASTCLDGRLYYNGTTGVNWERIGGVCTKITAGGTPGNVVGPASAVDNHLAVFDGTTGKLIKDGGAIPTATPAGSDTQIQFNNAGSFGGVAGLTWVAPTVLIAGAPTTGPDAEVKVTGDTVSRVAMGINTADVARFSVGPGNAVRNTFLEWGGSAGTWKFGSTDVDTAPVPQNLMMQNALAGGTSNVAGADFTIKTSQSKGNVAGGRLIVQVAPAGSTGTVVNALENKFIVGPTGVTVSVGETTSALTDLLINPTTKASGNLLDLQVNSSSKFSLSSTALVVASGISSTFNGSITTVGSADINSGRYVSAAAAGAFYIIGRSQIMSPSDSIWTMANQANTDFTRLQFGGTTNSYNAIGRDAVNGFTFQSAAGTATWNDPSTANSGTVANRYMVGIAAPTLTSTGTSVTNTVASTVYIGGAPTDSTNTTSTTKYALNVAAGNTNLGGNLSVAPGTLADTVPGLTYTATLPTVMSGTNNAVNFQITTAGSSSTLIRGLNIDLLAGYTGALNTRGLRVVNAVAGTQAGLVTQAGNHGILGSASATTTGTNVGASASASGGDISTGVLGQAVTAKNSATNIGGAFYGLNSGTSPIQIGVFGGLMSSDPTFASAAALFDNGGTTSPILLARDNGSTVFTIADGGPVTATSSISAASYLTATNCSDSAGAAACGSAAAGSFVIDAASTSTVVSTTAVTANSQVFVVEDSSLSTRLGITCNTQSVLILGPPVVTARTAGTSFTVSIVVGPTTNPACYSYKVVN